MSDNQKSRCHCESVELSFPHKANFTFSCHCDTCQKLVSGGRLLGFAVPTNNLSVTGEVATYTYQGGSGKNITLSFCSKCSTQLFAKPEAIENITVIRSNMLRNPLEFTAEKVLFEENSCLWDQLHS